LELINTFKSLLSEKRTEIRNLKDRYGNGYESLISTESSVNIMEKELVDLQPILIQKGKETEEKLGIVSKETEAADKIKSAVSIEENDA
jgi:dynein heavy chain